MRNNHNWCTGGGLATGTIDLIQMDILSCAKRTKIIATRTSSGFKIWQNALAAGAPPRAPLGELAAVPHSWILGRKMGKRKGGEEMSERNVR